MHWSHDEARAEGAPSATEWRPKYPAENGWSHWEAALQKEPYRAAQRGKGARACAPYLTRREYTRARPGGLLSDLL